MGGGSSTETTTASTTTPSTASPTPSTLHPPTSPNTTEGFIPTQNLTIATAQNIATTTASQTDISSTQGMRQLYISTNRQIDKTLTAKFLYIY